MRVDKEGLQSPEATVEGKTLRVSRESDPGSHHIREARPAVSAKETGKAARREAIVNAAERLIRDSGGTDFSMLDLARQAGVSPATPYNLFGTKSGIFYALLNRSADRMFAVTAGAPPASSPEAGTLAAADTLAHILTSDPVFYRPLYGFLMGVPDPEWRPPFIERARAFWLSAFPAGAERPLGLDRTLLAQLLVTQALGCIEMWVHREIEEGALACELKRSVAAVLLGLRNKTDASPLLRKILLMSADT